jgi:hypothetical protein
MAGHVNATSPLSHRFAIAMILLTERQFRAVAVTPS